MPCSRRRDRDARRGRGLGVRDRKNVVRRASHGPAIPGEPGQEPAAGRPSRYEAETPRACDLRGHLGRRPPNLRGRPHRDREGTCHDILGALARLGGRLRNVECLNRKDPAWPKEPRRSAGRPQPVSARRRGPAKLLVVWVACTPMSSLSSCVLPSADRRRPATGCFWRFGRRIVPLALLTNLMYSDRVWLAERGLYFGGRLYPWDGFERVAWTDDGRAFALRRCGRWPLRRWIVAPVSEASREAVEEALRRVMPAPPRPISINHSPTGNGRTCQDGIAVSAPRLLPNKNRERSPTGPRLTPRESPARDEQADAKYHTEDRWAEARLDGQYQCERRTGRSQNVE